MQEFVLSSRRAPASPRSGGSSPPALEAGGDESKTRKHFLSPHAAYTRILFLFPSSPRSAAAVAVALLIAVSVCALLFLFRPVICGSRADALLLRSARFVATLDGAVSDFGALGVPWCRSKQGKTVEWTSQDLIEGLGEFVPIYEKRPITNNLYGMGFDHSFGLWFMARWLKPNLIIESGTFKGHSTWVLRQAMPDAKIISISPRHPLKYLKKGQAYVDPNCTYLAGREFVDFGNNNWKKVLKDQGFHDLSRALVFFDDHQNELKRLKQALKAGFRHLIFEDNYDTGTGDHYSLRQICDQPYIRGGGHSCFKDSDEARIRAARNKLWDKAVPLSELCGNGDAWWGVRGYMRDNFNHNNTLISYAEHFQNSRFVESVLDVYWELPPVAGPSLTHQMRYDPARASDPIIEDGRYGLFRKLGLYRLDPSVFNGYTQMVYVQISPAASQQL